MIHQLRIHEIFEYNKAAFHARFRDHAAGIMARHGFHIVGMREAKSAEPPNSSTCCVGGTNRPTSTPGRRSSRIRSGTR